jgi:hypothetical protein
MQGCGVVRAAVMLFEGFSMKRRFFSSLEKAMGRKAANQFIESIDFNSQLMVSCTNFYSAFSF